MFERPPQGSSNNGEELKDPNRRKFLGLFGKAVIGAATYKLGEDIAHAAGSSERSVAEKELEQLRKKWAEYKEILLNKDLRTNISQLEILFGDEARHLLGKAKMDIYLFDQLVNDEKQGKDVVATETDLVRATIDDYELLWDKEVWEQRWEKDAQLERGSEVVGFEAMGRSNDEIKKLLEEWFGRTWAYGSVSRIEYKDTPKSLKTFNVAGDTPVGDITDAFYRHGDESLTLYKEEEAEDINELKRVLSHELAHTWDWERDRRLPLQERIQMLSEAMRLFADPDHFHSEYVEFDTPEEFKDLPTEQILYRQAKEFWATLNEEYDTRPAILKKHPKDYALVSYWRERLTKPASNH